MEEQDKTEVKDNDMLMEFTADVVAAYLGNNSVSANQIPEVIETVHKCLSKIADPKEPEAEPLKPAVPVKKSVHHDFIICLEDGKKLKMLKRHLRSSYDMSPEEYRAKWGLPADYPMVAPAYSERRSEFAKKIGLGRKPDSGS